VNRTKTRAHERGAQAHSAKKLNFPTRLRSSSFKVKKAVYKNSPYELTRMVSKVSSWAKEEITERQKTLADLALKAWPL